MHCNYISGNASLEEAEVIFVADVDKKWSNSHNLIQLINQIWHNHLVLMERIPCRQRVLFHDEHPLTRGLKREILVKGWDHPHFERSVKLLKFRKQRINHWIRCVSRAIKAENWSHFFRKKTAFESLMKLGSPQLQKEMVEMRKLLTQGFYQPFYLSLCEAIKKIKRDQRSLASHLYAISFQSRLAYLKHAIQEGLRMHTKVIVLLDGNLVLRNSRLTRSAFDLQKIEEFMKSKKFVILTYPDTP